MEQLQGLFNAIAGLFEIELFVLAFIVFIGLPAGAALISFLFNKIAKT